MRSYWDEDLAILSAENVSFSVETAGLGSRLAALSIDTLLQLLVMALVSLGLAGLEEFVGLSSMLGEFWLSVGTAIYGVFAFLVFFGYYFIFEWLWDGQTPGKRQIGIRVTMNNGLPLSLWPALIRNAVRVVDFLPFFYGFGSVIAVSNSLSQRGGDLCAGTIVVSEGKREKVRGTLKINQAVEMFLQAATTIPGQETPAQAFVDEPLRIDEARAIDADALALSRKINREDYELARDFLARRETLPTVARQRLGKSLATRLAGAQGFAAPDEFEAFLESTVAQLAKVYAG